MGGYADKSRLAVGTDIIPVSAPNSEEYQEKADLLEKAKWELETLEKDHKETIVIIREIEKKNLELEKKLSKFTQKDRKSLLNYAKQVNNRIKATYNSTTKE